MRRRVTASMLRAVRGGRFRRISILTGRCASVPSPRTSASCGTCRTTRRSASATRCTVQKPIIYRRRIGSRAASAVSSRGCPKWADHLTARSRTAAHRQAPPELTSVSLNHHEQSDWLLRRVVEEAVETACAGMALPEIEMNGAGSCRRRPQRRQWSLRRSRRRCVRSRRSDRRRRLVG